MDHEFAEIQNKNQRKAHTCYGTEVTTKRSECRKITKEFHLGLKSINKVCKSILLSNDCTRTQYTVLVQT